MNDEIISFLFESVRGMESFLHSVVFIKGKKKEASMEKN